MKKNRRSFLSLGAAALATSTGCKPGAETAKPPSELGAAVSEYGSRSPFEKVARLHNSPTPATASSRTPLDEIHGILTPPSLHFERHHAGVPQLDPSKHELLVHGLTDRQVIFTLADLKRLPSVSRIHFLECAGNSGSEWRGAGGDTAQRSHGLASCSEWTGVSVKTLLEECGLQKAATWVIAEGADACLMARSIPLEKMLDDAVIAYGQNGEALRPEQGYPLRLLLPGWEGNMSIKWLRRLHVTSEPMRSREETSHYTDLLADGKAREFSFEMDAKSLILKPSGGQQLPGPGAYEISGIAWSGRGRIEKVEISLDGGEKWIPASLDEPRLPKAFTRFRLAWPWSGADTIIQSRATDETGYVQPSTEQLIAARGPNSTYHHNGIKRWRIETSGKVTNV